MKKSSLIILSVVLLVIFFVIIQRVNKSKCLIKIEQNKDKITWNDISCVLRTGKVEQVHRRHFGGTVVVFDNGDAIVLKSDGYHDIFREIDKCGRPCDDIMAFTE